MQVDITYQELFDKSIDLIVSLCNNISGRSSIPSQLRSDYSTYIASNNAASLRMTVSSRAVSDISESEVRKVFHDFMSGRGVVSKLPQKVTARGMFNFLNTLSVFCRTYMAISTSTLVSESYIVFLPYGIPLNVSNADITGPDNVHSLEASDMLRILNDVIASNLNMMPVVYRYALSSSSCSCSSSSSSSSCSSSSTFISFMEI